MFDDIDWQIGKETTKDILAVAMIIGIVLALFTFVVAALHDDRDGNKISVTWDGGDIINNETFIDSYKHCTEQYDRSTGQEFEQCLIVSYNRAKQGE